MATVQHAWSLYKNWADLTEDAIKQWADPSQQYVYSSIKDYPLMRFSTAFACVIGYLLFVFVGTLIMKRGNVTPFNTRGFQFIYNPIQVALCSYMCIETAILLVKNDSKIICTAYDAKSPVFDNVIYTFYASKLLDFMDTVFIIAGKKWKQLSFLHVYHHSTVFMLYWLNANAAYDGDMYVTVLLNAAIHFIMYTYYFVSYHTKNIWWKKYLTAMQIIQFMLMNAHAITLYTKGCSETPKNIIWNYFCFVITMLVLFGNFYTVNYIIKKKTV